MKLSNVIVSALKQEVIEARTDFGQDEQDNCTNNKQIKKSRTSLRNEDTTIENHQGEVSADQGGKEKYLKKYNPLGPMHTLLDIVQQNELEHLYSYNDKVVLCFVTKILTSIIGKRKYKKYCSCVPLRQFVTLSDESFGIILLENNAGKWYGEVEGDGTIPALYSEAKKGSGEAHGWTENDINRYLYYYEKCMNMRMMKERNGST